MKVPQAFLNGRFVPASEAVISVEDAGFLLGVTVSEQLRTFRGRLFRFEDHLARLRQSLATVGIDPGLKDESLIAAANELVEHNHALLDPNDDLGLSLFVTPGIHANYAAGGVPLPTVCMHTYPLPFHFWANKYASGDSLILTEYEQVSPRAWPPQLKCRSRMHYYLADRSARRIEHGSRAMLLSEQGFVRETATANILATRGRAVMTPPLDQILPGISLTVVRELALAERLVFAESEITCQKLAGADEVFLSSTPFCLLPVSRVNGQAVSGGQPGRLFTRLIDAWSRQAGFNIIEQAVRFSARGS